VSRSSTVLAQHGVNVRTTHPEAVLVSAYVNERNVLLTDLICLTDEAHHQDGTLVLLSVP
jgi:hypothetical protein